MVFDIDHTHSGREADQDCNPHPWKGTWCLELGCGNSATWVQPGTPSVTLDGQLGVKGLKGKKTTHFILCFPRLAQVHGLSDI